MAVLFERYTDLVFLVAMKYLKDEAESKDAVMLVFEKLLRDLPRYEVRNFKYWLHTVVKNQCLSLLEKQQRSRQQAENFRLEQDEDMEYTPAFSLDGEQDGQEKQLAQLEVAISMLKAEQRQCVELFYLQRKSYKEVAEITGFSLLQVKSYIQNGKRNLKKHMIELG